MWEWLHSPYGAASPLLFNRDTKPGSDQTAIIASKWTSLSRMTQKRKTLLCLSTAREVEHQQIKFYNLNNNGQNCITLMVHLRHIHLPIHTVHEALLLSLGFVISVGTAIQIQQHHFQSKNMIFMLNTPEYLT